MADVKHTAEEVNRCGGTSALGAKLGARLANLADRHRLPDDPSPCSTCGLKRGTLANMNNRTMMDAMNVLLGLDGEVILFFDPRTGLPLQIRGDAPRIGSTEINLKSVTMRAAQ